jgi:hypothetical protein
MNRKNPWLVFLLPFVVFMLVGSLEPTPEKAGGSMIGLSLPYSQYPLVYTLKIILTLAAMIFVLPGYREFVFRISPLAVVVGVLGVVLWIGICRLDIEHRFLQPLLDKIDLGWLIGSGARAGFNPFEQLKDQPLWAWMFLVIRFLGLALVVPVIEEFFLRGFAMRFVVEQDWWNVPFGKVNRTALILGTVLPMLMHPAELLAAAVWFSLVTWLMLRTKNIWDCVAAHAVTNFLLGVYVVTMGGEAWRLM